MPYEDTALQEIKLAEPEAEILDQNDDPKPKEGYEYIDIEFILPRGDEYQGATLEQRKRNINEELIGLRNSNPILNTRVYEAVLSGGEGVELLTNQVAEYLLNSCDVEGSGFIIFRDILDHQYDDKSIINEYGFIHQPK